MPDMRHRTTPGASVMTLRKKCIASLHKELSDAMFEDGCGDEKERGTTLRNAARTKRAMNELRVKEESIEQGLQRRNLRRWVRVYTLLRTDQLTLENF